MCLTRSALMNPEEICLMQAALSSNMVATNQYGNHFPHHVCPRVSEPAMPNVGFGTGG